MEEVFKQVQGSDPGPPTWDRKDKSRDSISSFEGQIVKLKSGVKDTKGDVDLLERCIEEAMGDL